MVGEREGLAPRRAALAVLADVRQGRPFEQALDRALEPLPDADRRLAHELAAGVLRRQQMLDDRLGPPVPRGWGRGPRPLQDLLRLGAFQLTALERVPAHAAVDTSVLLAKESGGVRAGGFVNAVLRRLDRDAEAHAPPAESGTARLARAHSHPLWLVERWVARYGQEETERLLEWNDQRPRLVLQPARESLETLTHRWLEAGIEVQPAPFGAGLVTNRRRPEDLPGYAEGAFMVQDPAQALLAWYADLPPGVTLYDASAAPGGKTIALGRSGARVIAGDVSRPRVRRLAGNLERAGSGREHALAADLRHSPIRPVGAVLLDAPCLGTGTFGRHPDARWRVTPQALEKLAGVQAELLDHAAELVAPNGLLLYATCSLKPEENAEQVKLFLARQPDFHREPAATFPPTLLSEDGDLAIVPQRHGTDGAYAARLRRA